MTSDDTSVLAVLDAYKWWIVSDFGFLQLTGVLNGQGGNGKQSGQFRDRGVLRLIARTYTVSRNIPSHDQDAEAEKLVASLSSPEVSCTLKLPLPARAIALRAFVDANPVRLKADGQENIKERRLASALTKLTWFLQPDDWTIFDKNVGSAVLRQTGAGSPQMAAFYDKIGPCWKNTSDELCRACVDHGFNRRMGYRIVDKYLFLHGVGMYVSAPNGKPKLDKTSRLADRLENPAILAMRASLLSFAAALPKDLGKRLVALGQDVKSCLIEARWVRDPQ